MLFPGPKGTGSAINLKEFFIHASPRQAKAKKVNQASAAACFCCLLKFPAICRCLLPLAAVCDFLLVFAI